MGKVLVIKDSDFSQVAVDIITPPGMYSVTALAYPEAGGTVTGGGAYRTGEQVTLTATSNNGYKFTGWSDGNTSPVRSIVVGESDLTFTAQFVVDTSTTLLLPANIIAQCSQTNFNLKSWISSALAKFYFNNNKSIHVSYIYIKPSSAITSLELSVYNLPDENTVPTLDTTITVSVNSSMIDMEKGIDGLYKVPVDINCAGKIISFGSNAAYFNGSMSVPSEQVANAGWWVMTNPSTWTNRAKNDDAHPISVGYVVEPM